MVKVRVFGQNGAADRVIQTAADGNGPVNALDAAVRKALAEFFPRYHRNPPRRLQGTHHRLERRHRRVRARAD